MSSAASVKRPFGVTIVTGLLVIAGLWNLWIGFLSIFSSFGDNPTFEDFYGVAHSIPTFQLWMFGLLSIFLGLIYFWLTRMTLVGSATAHSIISMFMIINIVFAFFRLPYGWFSIMVSLLVLLMVNTQAATAWFKQAD
ncbi:MAG: hypothetical protein PHU75_08800 [Candidatus Nanopelagicales bacterium]|nr:hypothetical protein [Candidatus Nanopelagicales bacterium]